jgi:hypothetical protein
MRERLLNLTIFVLPFQRSIVLCNPGETREQQELASSLTGKINFCLFYYCNNNFIGSASYLFNSGRHLLI